MRRFFRKRFRFEGLTWPVWKDVLAETEMEEEVASDEGSDEESEEVEETQVVDEEGETSKGVKFAAEAVEETETQTPPAPLRLDLVVEASGFGRQMQRELEDVSSNLVMLTSVHG